MLKNKVCFVSGASRGIGREITRVFAENHAIVYANIRKHGALDDWFNTLPEETRQMIIPVTFDIRDSNALKTTIMQMREEYGHIDVWVNNAAIAYNEAIGMISKEHVQEMFEINVYPVIESIQLVARIMTRQKSGSIINISSIVGVEGDSGQVAYSATKGAIISLTKSAAKELASHQIRVNSVAPGLTQTDLMEQTDPKFLEKRLSSIGMGRVAVPRDIANTCLYLASDLSSYVTGQIIGVNGSSKL